MMILRAVAKVDDDVATQYFIVAVFFHVFSLLMCLFISISEILVKTYFSF